MSMYIPVLVPPPSAGPGGAGGLFDAYALLRDEKASGTAGGIATGGSWQTRTLNTESFDVGGIVSLSSNQFTLQAGTYFIRARSPHLDANASKVKIRNVTDSTDAIIGASWTMDSSDTTQVDAWCIGRVTIAGAKAFELQYQVTTGGTTSSDLGQPASFGVVEVYAEVEIWREAA